MNKLIILAISLSLLGLGLSCSKDKPLSQIEEVRLNDIQIIGSHNSYKRPLNPKIIELIAKHDSKAAAHINYSHPSITSQLQLGLRHLEIDIVKDPVGGKFSHPKAEEIIQQTILTEAEREALNAPGFKVMHIPDLDFSSHCILFQSCLDELVAFSNEQPNHLPIIVLMNLKESNSKLIDGAEVLAFDADDYADLDKVLQTTFAEKLITPNDVKGQYASLEQAVLNKGWPALNNSSGRFLFILDGKSPQLDLYRSGHPSLSGRAMFASYPEGQPEAALMIRNDPIKDLESIKSLVKKGYLVRTRADGGAGSDTQIADVKLRTEKAFASGAQIISTDFYPGAPQVLPSDYVVSFKQGMLYRCNQRVRKTPCKLKG